MNDEVGTCTLWVKNVDGTHEDAVPVSPSHPQEENQVIIMKVTTEGYGLHLVFRRSDFAKMMALPNEGDVTEVAVGFEENDYE